MTAHAARLERLRLSIAETGVDALLVTSLPSVRYLTGFSGSNGMLVVTATESALVTDFRYAAQVRLEVAGSTRCVIERASLWSGLWTVLA